MELVRQFALDVRGPDGQAVPVQAGEVVAFYFSAHWCPPCRQFTPVLKQVHAHAMEPTGHPRYTSTPPKRLHVIFVSSDKSDGEMQAYLKEAHGPWSHVAFGCPGIQALSQHFRVQGIPALHVCSPDGRSVIQDARMEVMQAGGAAESARALVQRWRAQAGVRADVLPVGAAVRAHGLQGQPELNGCVGKVIGFDLGKERLVVEFADGKGGKPSKGEGKGKGRQVALRPANCAQKAFAEDGEEHWADEPATWANDPAVSWSPGTVVCVEGLVSKPEMNGKRGTLRTFDAASGRFDVELSASEVLRLKRANIVI